MRDGRGDIKLETTECKKYHRKGKGIGGGV